MIDFEREDRVTTDFTTQFLRFVRQPPHPKRKTATWQVRAVKSGVLLGKVKWHGAWRQYAFFPQNDTLYNPQCLREVAQFAETATVQKVRDVADLG